MTHSQNVLAAFDKNFTRVFLPDFLALHKFVPLHSCHFAKFKGKRFILNNIKKITQNSSSFMSRKYKMNLQSIDVILTANRKLKMKTKYLTQLTPQPILAGV